MQQNERRELRRLNRPQLSYPELPVCYHREEILKALEERQVVIVAGDTGSGKSTQLPKLCLEAGRGISGLIGHTQPRRLAARSIASRLASELDTQLGRQVGFKIRFSDRTADDTLIKVMTDGMLLAEIHQDKWLRQYDTIIIDEAHERSLNIDFLLGYLRQLLPERPDLKVIITSATLDHQRFAAHFWQAPLIEVAGRTYPVDIHYAEPELSEELSQVEQIAEGVETLETDSRGDILVFLATEREIFEAADYLRRQQYANTEILPLFSRLSQRDQDKIFAPQSFRRIILATNVAETSLTVPGIKYVIDSGYVRISRYSHRNKVQRLPIEPISRASADQRAGRCGRTEPGICLRLYTYDDYCARPAHTDPEIRRTSLAAVILQMAVLRIGPIEQFPFLQPPQTRYIEDGYRQLYELGALNARRRVTRRGRAIAPLQVDPRFARMLLEAQTQDCLAEVLVIVSFLSIQDPRERPQQAREQADACHRRFQHNQSDFMSIVQLWQEYQAQVAVLSGNALRRYCQQHFLSPLRMRSWVEVYHQLKRSMTQRGARLNQEPAGYEAIHKALLSGLLTQVGYNHRDKEYQGPRGVRFFIFPGSGQFKATPKWVMAAELVETSKLFARTVARMTPEWVETMAGHLLKYRYEDAHWSRKHGKVMAYETVTLYGLELATRRRISYERIAPEESRELFIRGALVEGAMHTRADFVTKNRALLEQVEDLENKARRRDILVDEETLYAYYDQVLPADVCSQARFNRWVKNLSEAQRNELVFERSQLMQHEAASVTEARFPDTLTLGQLHLPLHYHFQPGSDRDGLTLTVPVEALPQLDPTPLDWLVPGLFEEKLTALLRALPKRVRRALVPVPQYVRALAERLGFQPAQPLKPLLAREITRITGMQVDPEIWNDAVLPEHLVIKVAVVDEQGEQLDRGTNVPALQRKWYQQAVCASRENRESDENTVYQDWSFGDLSTSRTVRRPGMQVTVYPYVQAVANGVRLAQAGSEAEARRGHRQGLLALLKHYCASELASLEQYLPVTAMAPLTRGLYQDTDSWQREIIEVVLAEHFAPEAYLPYSRAAFERWIAEKRPGLGEALSRAGQQFMQALKATRALQKALKCRNLSMELLPLYQSVQQEMEQLVYPGFFAATPVRWRERLPLYLAAQHKRLEKAPTALKRDRQYRRDQQELQNLLERRITALQWPSYVSEVVEIEWLVKELWLSWYTPEVSTVVPVSYERLEKMIRRLGHASSAT